MHVCVRWCVYKLQCVYVLCAAVGPSTTFQNPKAALRAHAFDNYNQPKIRRPEISCRTFLLNKKRSRSLKLLAGLKTLSSVIYFTYFSPAGYPTRHLVTRTSLLSLRVPVHCLLSRIRTSIIYSHTSTSPPPPVESSLPT